MNKQDVRNLFNERQDSKIAEEILGIHRRTYYLWPDQLKQIQVDHVIGAATRLGLSIPDRFIPNQESAA